MESGEPDWLFINGQDNTTRFADDLVTGSGQMDAQAAGTEGAVFVPLAACQHQDMLVSFMIVAGNPAGFVVPQQGCGGTTHAVTIEPVNVHSLAEWLPVQLRGMPGQTEEVRQINDSGNWQAWGSIHR